MHIFFLRQWDFFGQVGSFHFMMKRQQKLFYPSGWLLSAAFLALQICWLFSAMGGPEVTAHYLTCARILYPFLGKAETRYPLVNWVFYLGWKTTTKILTSGWSIYAAFLPFQICWHHWHHPGNEWELPACLQGHGRTTNTPNTNMWSPSWSLVPFFLHLITNILCMFGKNHICMLCVFNVTFLNTFWRPTQKLGPQTWSLFWAVRHVIFQSLPPLAKSDL
jgi:hypothetical protein